MNSIANLIAGIFLSLASLFGYQAPTSQPMTFGAVYPVGGTTFYLAGSGVTSSASTITLTSFQTPDGRNLTMSMFGTTGYGAFEPGSSKLEDITFTGITQNSNGTATLTGVTRGNDFVTPYAASTTLAKAHAGGVPFILTNTAGFYSQFLPVNNTATSTATLVFSSTTPPKYDGTPVWASFTTQVLASVEYVNSVVAAGAANASETVKGIIQLATGAQAAAGTSSGSTGARLSLGANLASSTPSSTTLTGTIPTTVGQYLSQAWLDLTANFITSGAWTFLASVAKPLTLNGLAYVFPTSQSVGGILQTDGSGNLSWGSGWVFVTSTTTSTALHNMAATTTAYARYRIFITTTAVSPATVPTIVFNNDYASNYGDSVSINGVYTIVGSSGSIPLYPDTGVPTTTPIYAIADVSNTQTSVKKVSFTGGTNPSGAVTSSILGSGIWNNTSNQITTVLISAGASTFASGATMTIYGSNQ